MNNVVQANTDAGIDVNDSTATLVGGTNPGEGHTAGYIELTSARDCVVVGNTTQRERVLGNGPFQPPTRNNRIGGPTLAVRNFITGTGTWTNGSGSSGGIPTGIAVEVQQAEGTLIENNWIGTTTDGLAQGHPATVVGILLWDGKQNTVIRSNRIAGIYAAGLGFWSTSRFGVGIQPRRVARPLATARSSTPPLGRGPTLRAPESERDRPIAPAHCRCTP